MPSKKKKKKNAEVVDKNISNSENLNSVVYSETEKESIRTRTFENVTKKITVIPQMKDRIRAVIFGNCIGDAIGLLTEFLSKRDSEYYINYMKNDNGLQYKHKLDDFHRSRWITGDWTDDSDQMILILQMLIDKETVDYIDYSRRLKFWAENGFPEIGDNGGFGIGSTTYNVLYSKEYDNDPHKAANSVWESSGKVVAPNGGVMRTSILGIYEFTDMDKVYENTLKICKVTHADPRCQASCLAVTITIANMLKMCNEPEFVEFSKSKIKEITEKTKKIINRKFFDNLYEPGSQELKEAKNEFKDYLRMKNLEDLHLDEQSSIGYTYKCMGAGFWALRQDNFRKALTDIVMEGGDADTNGAVAGALLGAKLGFENIDKRWFDELAEKPKQFLEGVIKTFTDKFFDFKQ